MAETVDTQASERYPVNADTSCPFISPVVEEFGTVRVRDVSMQGLSLLVSRRIEAGALLTVVLENRARGFAKTVLVRVVRITATGGGFLVGGAFVTPLTQQEVSTLVL